MTKEKFNWKGLFINSESVAVEKTEQKETPSNSSSVSFPKTNETTSKFPVQPPKTTIVSNSILDTVVEMYESGFESLNQPGYDFYEFFKAVKAVNSSDPSVYKMAFTMAQGIDSEVTKAKLLTQAEFYVNEIERVHKQYLAKGSSKKNNVIDSQKVKKDNLSAEISALEKKLIEIQNQISTKKNELQSIDIDLMNEVSEIDQKIVANDAARTKILETITNVVDGIKNNL